MMYAIRLTLKTPEIIVHLLSAVDTFHQHIPVAVHFVDDAFHSKHLKDITINKISCNKASTKYDPLVVEYGAANYITDACV